MADNEIEIKIGEGDVKKGYAEIMAWDIYDDGTLMICID